MNDFKCLLGLHKRELLETKEIKDPRGEVTKTIYVTQCKNCGKIHAKIVQYEPYR